MVRHTTHSEDFSTKRGPWTRDTGHFAFRLGLIGAQPEMVFVPNWIVHGKSVYGAVIRQGRPRTGAPCPRHPVVYKLFRYSSLTGQHC